MAPSVSLKTVQSCSTNEALIDEGARLLSLDLDDLYATLGMQLLGRASPGTAAGIVAYFSGLRSSCEAREFYPALPASVTSGQLTSELRVIYEGLKADGKQYLVDMNEDLRRALCSENVFAASGAPTRSALAVVSVIIGAALRLPRDFDAVAVTVGVIMLKVGLRNFCAGGPGARTDTG